MRKINKAKFNEYRCYYCNIEIQSIINTNHLKIIDNYTDEEIYFSYLCNCCLEKLKLFLKSFSKERCISCNLKLNSDIFYKYELIYYKSENNSFNSYFFDSDIYVNMFIDKINEIFFNDILYNMKSEEDFLI